MSLNIRVFRVRHVVPHIIVERPPVTPEDQGTATAPGNDLFRRRTQRVHGTGGHSAAPDIRKRLPTFCGTPVWNKKIV